MYSWMMSITSQGAHNTHQWDITLQCLCITFLQVGQSIKERNSLIFLISITFKQEVSTGIESKIEQLCNNLHDGAIIWWYNLHM